MRRRELLAMGIDPDKPTEDEDDDGRPSWGVEEDEHGQVSWDTESFTERR